MIDRDIVLAKLATIERCLARIRTVTGGDAERIDAIDIEDIVVLNLQRAVQAAIDLGAHVLAKSGLAMPASQREIFLVLEREQILSSAVAAPMQRMCGFRNIAVHDYQQLARPIVKAIVRDHLGDLEQFGDVVRDLMTK